MFKIRPFQFQISGMRIKRKRTFAYCVQPKLPRNTFTLNTTLRKHN